MGIEISQAASIRRHKAILLFACITFVSATLNRGGQRQPFVDLGEIPETIPVISTSLKEFMYADATNGIQFIEPPLPLHTGAANISFPIKLPQGRQGMAPVLSLVYNSDGGNSWTGLGWDIGTSSISVETRWGVPRYSAGKETETYLLDGRQMAPVAHRGELVDRSPGRSFHMRIEGTFNEIIRHGSSPSGYYWEVRSKDGLVSYYGGDESGASDESRLMAPGGAAEWYLSKQIDKNGNTIEYSYAQSTDPGVSGSTVPGQMKYLSEIRYTGYGDSPGPFKVSFFRNGTERRPDIEIDVKYGVKKVISDLLSQITVSYNDRLIRTYQLDYAEGAFSKTLLTAIHELGPDGKTFYSHTFEYFDDMRDENGNFVAHEAAVAWDVPDDNVKGPVLGGTSVLGAAGSTGFSAGSALTVGVNDFMLYSKVNTGGGTYEYAQTDGTGLTALVDINGDGLPDKVFKEDGKLFYRNNVPGGNRFGNKVEIQGITDFNIFVSRTNSIGGELNPGIGASASAYVGYQNSTTKNTISSFFTDFNGDGLVDIARSGTVYFNTLNADGHPVFSTNSALSLSRVSSEAPVNRELITPDPEEQQRLREQFPLHDQVRFWEAPRDGRVEVVAPVRLLENTSQAAADYRKQDGVTVTVQVRNRRIWSQRIEWGDFSTYSPGIPDQLNVEQGDRIYFRVQSVEDGAYDAVIWDPIVRYINESDNTGPTGKMQNTYIATGDYVLASCQVVNLDLDGEIAIEGSLSKPQLSDDITAQVVRTDAEGNINILLREEIPWNSAGTFDFSGSEVEVAKGDMLEFQVLAQSQVDWSAIEWTPRMSYTESYVDTVDVIDDNGNPLLSFCPAPTFGMFNGEVVQPELWIAPSTGQVNVEMFDVNMPGGDSEATLTVKKPRELIRKEVFSLDGDFTVPSFSFDVEVGDSVYLEWHTLSFDRDSNIAERLDDIRVTLERGGAISNVLCGLNTRRIEEDIIFGPMYRHWGHFTWNGNETRAELAIDESALTVNEDLGEMAEDLEDIEDAEDLEGMETVSAGSDPYIILVSDPKSGRWLGSDNLSYMSGDTLSSSRLGRDDLLPNVFEPAPGALETFCIETETVANSVSGGGSSGAASFAAGGSLATTRNLFDIVDFNGDQYPDIVTNNRVQYTTQTGGLEPNFITHGLGNHVAKSVAAGLNVGGSYNPSDASNTGGTSGSGSNNRTSRQKTRTNKSSAKAGNATESASASGGLGGSFSADRDSAEQSWLDINGDGLPDLLEQDGTVRLNAGYTFLPPENWGFQEIWGGTSLEVGLGGGINISSGSIEAGVSLSRSDTEVRRGLLDVNSDGLVDMIVSVDDLVVRLNTGNGFGPEIAWAQEAFVDKGVSDGQSANTAFTVCVPITFLGLGIKICLNPGGAVFSGTSTQRNQVHDIDGDGFADLLQSDSDGELVVRRSLIGRTNLLKAVNRPLNGRFELDYERSESTVGLPYAKWLLTEVEQFDGLTGDGADTQRYMASYSDAQHDRHEREFLGYGEVAITDVDPATGTPYRVTRYNYDNSSYYLQGLLLAKQTENADGGVFEEVRYTYELRDVDSGGALPPDYANLDFGMAFPALTSVIEKYCEGDQANCVSTALLYDYNNYGEIVKYTHTGSGSGDDVLVMERSFHEPASVYIRNIPERVFYRNGTGELLRQFGNEIDDSGNVTRRSEVLNSGEEAIYDYRYDAFGNIAAEVRPPNHLGEQLDYSYTYDSEVNTYAISVTDGYGYTESASFDVVFGQMLDQTDMNGNRWEYEYDQLGRLVNERSPNEVLADVPYLRRYEYADTADVAYAVCYHFDPGHEEDITTYAFYDGLARQVQTKTPVALFAGEGQEDELVMRVSGGTNFDAYGRVVENYYSITEPIGEQNRILNTNLSTIAPERYVYDIMDRTVQITEPDGPVTEWSYSIDQANDGTIARRSSETDPENRTSDLYFDMRGRIIQYGVSGSGEEFYATARYNAVSDLLAIIDSEGNEHAFEYDTGGRQIAEIDPNRGVTEYTYDAAGNIITKVTSELKRKIPQGGEVRYTYDKERLVRIDYPKNFQNLVQFHYGEPGADFNRAGKIWLVEDASGGEELFFGPTEEITKSIRTILVNRMSFTYIMQYEHDTWNRIKRITYPDNEVVDYAYNRGGKLRSVKTEKENRPYTIIDQLGYDNFGEIVFQKMGNGVVSEFVYDEVSRLLTADAIRGSSGPVISNDYAYNGVRAPLDIKGSGSSDQAITAPADHNFTYDGLHRMVGASGQWRSDSEESYEASFAYTDLFNFSEMRVERTSDGTPAADESFSASYEYAEAPHAPSRIRGRRFAYDENGNIKGSVGTEQFGYQLFVWDEENRLVANSNNGYITQYTYDAYGRRVIRSQTGYQGIFIDGAPAGFVRHGEDYTIHVNALMTARPNGFTKHYYTEEARVASKNGTGKFFANFTGQSYISAGDLDFSRRALLLQRAADQFFAASGQPPGPPTLPWYYAQPEISGTATQAITTDLYDLQVPQGWPGPVGPPDTLGPPGPPTWFEPRPPRDSLKAGYNYQPAPTVEEINQFYYHPDIFGNINYVTNNLGEVSYQVEYTPTGLIFVESSDGNEVRPNLFRNRDRDEEAGLYYFEGHYYLPEEGIFANPGYDRDFVAGTSPYALIPGMQLDPSFELTRLQAFTDLSIAHTEQAGGGGGVAIGATDGGSGGGINAIGVRLSSAASNDKDKAQGTQSDDPEVVDRTNNPRNQRVRQRARQQALGEDNAPRNVQRSRTNPLTGIDDPRYVQFKRRAQKIARTGRQGRVKRAKPKLNRGEAKRRSLARARAKANAQKLVNRQFTFAPGDISSIPGDRRAVRLGGPKYRRALRKFQSKPGKTR